MQNISWDYNLSILERTLYFSIYIPEAVINDGSYLYQIKEGIDRLQQSSSWIRLAAQVTIARGVIQTSGSAVEFTLESAINHDGWNASLHLNHQDAQPIGDLSFSRSKDIFGEIHLQKAPLQALYPLVKPFLNIPQEWNVLSGKLTLDGSLHGIDSPIPFEGIGLLEEFHMENSEDSFILVFPEISVDYRNPTNPTSSILLKNGSITIGAQKDPQWVVDGFQAEASVENRLLSLSGKGHCLHMNVHTGFQLLSEWHFGEEQSQSADVSLKLDDGSSGRFVFRRLGGAWNFAEIDLEQCGKREFAFLQYLIKTKYPLAEELSFERGIFTLKANTYYTLDQAAEMRISQLDTSDIALRVLPWDCTIKATHVRGSLQGDLSQRKFLQTLSGDLSIAGGSIIWEDPEMAPYTLDEMEARIHIAHGMVQESEVQASFSNMHVSAQIDAQKPHEFITFRLEGAALDLASLLPSYLQGKTEHIFSKDRLSVVASGEKTDRGLSVQGAANVYESSTTGDIIDFGFLIEKTEGPSPFGHYSVHHIWFEGDDIPIHKYLQPIAVDDDKVMVNGFADALGTWSDGVLKLYYNARELTVENNDYRIYIPQITSQDASFACTHTIDTLHQSHWGSLPVSNGTFFLKNTNLTFFPVQTEIHIDNSFITAKDIETYCEGIFLAGELNVDCSSPLDGIFSVQSTVHTFFGRVDQAQNLFRHFNKPSHLIDVPLEGTITFLKPGTLRMHFEPEDYSLELDVRGEISEGHLKNDEYPLSLEEFSIGFDYNHSTDLLDLFDIQGTLFYGSSKEIKEFNLTDSHAHFASYSKGLVSFSFVVLDGQEEYVRFDGSTQEDPFDKSSLVIALDLNESHLGSLSFDALDISLRKGQSLELRSLEAQYDASTLINELLRFRHTGLFYLNRHLLAKLADYHYLEGTLSLKANFDLASSTLSINAAAPKVTLGDSVWHDFLFTCRKKGAVWTLDQFQIDQLSIAADFYKKDEEWRVNFLGARVGESILIGLEGAIDPLFIVFKGKVNLLEANLEALKEWPSFSSFIGENNLIGKFKGQGNFSIFSTGQVEVVLTSSARSLKIRDLKFADIEHASIHYSSATGLTIRNIETALQHDKTASTIAKLKVGSFSIVSSGDFEVGQFQFDVPAGQTHFLTTAFEKAFPQLIPPRLLQLLTAVKTNEPLHGAFDFETAQNRHAFKIALQPGTYHLLGLNFPLSEIIVEYDPFDFKISSSTLWNGHSYALALAAKTDNITEGFLSISQDPQSLNQSKAPLEVHWEIDENLQLRIRSLKGELSGLTFALQAPKKTHDGFITLSGDIAIDGSHLTELLPASLHEDYLAWQIGPGYLLKGVLSVPLATADFQPSFVGTLQGHDFHLKGYQFQSLSGELTASPEGATFTNIQVVDPAGNLIIPLCKCTKASTAQWFLEIPETAIRNLKPDRLTSLTETFSVRREKALVIQEIRLDGFHGIMGTPLSYRGLGSLTFVNPPKKNFTNILFSIPTEILSRIGLDLSMLTPITGQIHFEVRDNHIYLTEFKDMYSDGKISKFYLAHSDSKIDFDGNVDVLVRLKQSNVLLKLAELFTISIQGTLKKPIYNIQKPNGAI